MTPAPLVPHIRNYWPWLWLLLAVHVGLLGWALADQIAHPRADYESKAFVVTVVAVMLMAGTTFALSARYARAWAVAGTLMAAGILLTPTVVLVVLLLLLNAFVVGTRMLGFVGGSAATDSAALPFSVPMLAGLCIWIGIIAATANLPIHYAQTYGVALLLPLALSWRHTRHALARAASVFAPVSRLPSGTERGWMTLLQALIALHLFIVARPEVGYDAVSMHLQIPLMLEQSHRFAFDVTRYAWAVMPMGGDWMYATAYFLGGEAAARLANFCFGALACHLVYVLIRRHSRPELALASVVLLVSTPLAFLETGSLYVENLWTAFLLAALWLALELERDGRSPRLVLSGLALMAAGAMQCKTIGALWLVPLLGFALWRALERGSLRKLGGRALLVIAVGIVVAGWPYANAWLRTGNPVFPFMNAWFRSPLFDATTSFTNPLYAISLRPWSLYETIIDSNRFIEGANGAAGFHWLLLLPLIFMAFTRKRPVEQWLCVALATFFFLAVFSQQAYLRYLMPAFLLLAVIGGWAAADLPDRRATRLALLIIGGTMSLVQVRYMHTASWNNVTLCTSCAFKPSARDDYIALFMPNRIVGEYLNRNHQDARVGFFLLNGPAPAGFVGYSRAGNWHDVAAFPALATATTALDVAAIVERYRLTHAVFRTRAPEQENAAILAYRENFAIPIWRFQDFVVARVGTTER